MYNRNDGQNQAQTTSRPLENTGAPLKNDLAAIYGLLGDETVLLPVLRGGKKPLRKGWTELAVGDTRDSHYIHDLESNNIAVVLGRSSGNLISVDCDNESFMTAFERVNSKLCQETLRTKGARGCQFWFRMAGEYPLSVRRIQGEDGTHVGEFRSNGGCSIIAGIHPSGVPYQILNPVAPRVTTFSEINWPDGFCYSWIPSADEQITQRVGPAFTTNQQGAASRINAAFFAEWAKHQLDVIYDEERASFFLYNPVNGLWELMSDLAISERVWNTCNEWIDTQDSDQRDALKVLFTQKLRLDIVAILKSKVIKSGFFENGPFRGGRGKIFHTREGMCYWNPDATKWGDAFHDIPFLPDFRSRQQFPSRIVEHPKCPMFDSLLMGLVGEEDREFMIKVLGYLLIEENPGHHVLVIKGPSRQGKSQLTTILRGLFSTGAWGQLRTNQLNSRFETGSYADKHGIIGPDVGADFLSAQGAENLKSLTGGDSLDGEIKFSNKRLTFSGHKHVLITTNNSLMLAPGQDVTAWQSRLILIETQSKRPERPITNLGEKILRAESDAVFTKLMRGAWQAIHELETQGNLIIPAKFRLAGSDVVRVQGNITAWVDACISNGERAYPTEKLHALYSSWCQRNGACPLGMTSFSRDLRKLMGERGLPQSHNILNERARQCNGYRGLEVIE